MTAEATQTSELSAYRGRLAGGWDQLFSESGPRPQQRLLVEALEDLGRDGLLDARHKMGRLVRDEGILYGSQQGEEWIVDPLPVILGAQEWKQLEAGLRQRARLLGLLLADFYSEQRLLSSGVLPAEIVWGHRGFLHQACGIGMPGDNWLPLVAADLGRAPSGQWTVFADRAGTPAGAGYAMATRRLTARVMGDLHHDARPARLRTFFAAMRAGLQQIAPRPGHTPKGVLLWAGAAHETAFEQGFLATLLGYGLAEAEDLVLRNGQVWINAPEGRSLVDVILRRVDSDLCDPLEFRSDSQLGIAGLLEATRLGNVMCANPLGSGVLENPALMSFLPELAPQVLGEELLLPAAQTWWCGEPAQLSHVLTNLETLLLKPVDQTANSAIVGWELDAAAREDLVARIKAEPWAWCGQEAVEVSTAPVIGDDGLTPRRVVLRCFGVRVEHQHEFLPGGLARVSTSDEFRIVQPGRSLAKDVWVLDAEEPSETWAPSFEGGPTAVRSSLTLAPRVADNLFWLGRYSERIDGNLRLLRLALDLALDHGRRPASLGAQVLAAILVAGEAITHLDLGSGDLASAHKRIRSAITDGATSGTVGHAVARLNAAAHEVPDLMAGDLWHVLSQLERLIEKAGRRRDLPGVIDSLIASSLALAGINNESLTRDVTWAFVDVGFRVERAQRMLSVVAHTLGHERAAVVESQLSDAILEMGESLITQRRRSASGDGPRQPALAATQLLVTDRSNPRSVAFQLDRIVEGLLLIGDDDLAGRAAALATRVQVLPLADLFSGPRKQLHTELREQLLELRAIAEELNRGHLTRSAPRRATLSGWSIGTETEEDA